MIVAADAFVSLAALAGLLIVIATLRRRDRTGAVRAAMTWRFAFALGIVAFLLAVRVLDWTTGISFFDRLSTLAAGLVPLGALVVMEGLMRRHAPLPLKLGVAGGSLFFVVVALLPLMWREGWVTTGLFLYQLAVFVLIAAVVVLRDREALSAAENVALDRIALSLGLILPVLVTDYRGIVDLPVRLGGVAILGLAWLAVTLGRPREAHRDAVRAFLVLVLASILAAGTLALMFGLGASGFLQAAAIVLSAAILAALFAGAFTGNGASGSDLIDALARADTRDVERFLLDLRAHPAVADAKLLFQADLAELDGAALDRAFDALPVRRRGQGAGGRGNEQVDWLLERHEATHAFRVRRRPPMVVVLRLAGVATSQAQEAELRLVQRFAETVARAETVAQAETVARAERPAP